MSQSSDECECSCVADAVVASLFVIMLPLSYAHRRFARMCTPTRTSWRVQAPRWPPARAWRDSADKSLASYTLG